MSTRLAPYWLTNLDDHPLHKAIASCLEEPGKRIGTTLDHVSCGIDRLTATFKHGHTFNPAPRGRSSSILRMILLDEMRDLTFEMIFDVRNNELGVRPQLMVHIHWQKDTDDDDA